MFEKGFLFRRKKFSLEMFRFGLCVIGQCSANKCAVCLMSTGPVGMVAWYEKYYAHLPRPSVLGETPQDIIENEKKRSEQR